MDDVTRAPDRARARSRPRAAWRRNVSFVVGSILVFVTFVTAGLAPELAPHTPTSMAIGHELIGPSGQFPLGTDVLGRDVLSRVLYGGRASLGVVLPAVLLAAVVGVALGVGVGYFGGTFDLVLMRVFDVILAFPALLLAIVLMAFLGPSIRNLILSLAVLNLSQFTVLARSVTISAKSAEYVQAARAIGATHARVMGVHLLRNVAPPIVTQIALSLSTSILVEAALTFLGIGVQPPTPTWGGMLNDAQNYLTIAPWLALAPGFAIMLAVAGFNLVADGLRDLISRRAETY